MFVVKKNNSPNDINNLVSYADVFAINFEVSISKAVTRAVTNDCMESLLASAK